jgi:glycosyltransferase involved in cell wall biosynthesis
LKKIVYFSHGLSANGIETFLVNVLEKLDKNKYDVTVVIGIDEGVDCLHEQRVLDMGVKVYRAGDLDSLAKKYAYIKNVRAFLNKENFDIAHSNMDFLNGITLFLSKKAGIRKRICHAHNSKSQYNPTGKLAFIKKMVQKMYCFAMRKAILVSSTELIACSDVAGEYFYGNRDFALIYNGIRTESFIMPNDFDAQQYAESLGFKGDEKHRLVSVGRLSMQKNPAFALEVVNELRKVRDDFRYIWVGAGELENEVRTKIAELGLEDTVILTGVRTDIPQILGCCDFFFMPSLFEGLPFSLVEAQAANLKCIVSDVVTETADIGLITYVSLEKSAQDWAAEISKAFDSELPEKNQEKAKLFDISNTVRQLEEIYDK